MQSMLAELEPDELAQQICLHNFGLFRNIHPIEFLNVIWKKPGDDDVTPSLNFFIARFDKESYWSATEIVSEKDLKKRIKVLSKFIHIAQKSLELHNYFSLFALIAGLNLSPVQRLKKTWEVK